MAIQDFINKMQMPEGQSPVKPPFSNEQSIASDNARSKVQKMNSDKFDLPIPGESLTSELGQMPYEQPPQFTELSDLLDYIFNRLNSPAIQKQVLRLLDSGVPVSAIVEPLIMHGASEGKYNMDLGLLAVESVVTMLIGFGKRAGINVKLTPEKKERNINIKSLEKAFKEKKEMSEIVNKEPPEFDEKSLVIRGNV